MKTHVDQLLHKKLQHLEAEIKSMLKQKASKCHSELVRDWQTSHSKTYAVGERPATKPEIVHNQYVKRLLELINY
jgi:hypothetical protein